jgi:hypothetical protein
MSFPVIDLNTPTDLAFQWGWLLATVANLAMVVLVVLVFVLGATVRVPRARRDVADVAARNPLVRLDAETGRR